MSRIIVFSDFLKANDKHHILNNLEYVGTREGVQLNEQDADLRLDHPLDESCQQLAASENQKNLINSLIKQTPELKESYAYMDYLQDKNMYAASQFISEAIEMMHERDLSNEIYLNYISERPGVEKNEDEIHGLFDSAGDANKEKYLEDLKDHQGTVWRDIISLRREDAIATGFDHQKAWRYLLQSKVPALAVELGIPAADFRWCAAFHDEGHHPHVHLMFWDQRGKNGFQDKETIENFKSQLANHIFANEMYLHKELKNIYRKDLEDTFKNKIDEITDKTIKKFPDAATRNIVIKLNELSDILNDHGKKVYSYQSAEAKKLTDSIVESILSEPAMNQLLIEYMTQQKALTSFYKQDTDTYVQQALDQLIHPGKGDRKVLHNNIIAAAYEIKAINLTERVILDRSLPSLIRRIEHDVVADKNADPDKQVDAIIRLGNSLNMSTVDISSLCHQIVPDEEKVLEKMLYQKDEKLSKDDIRYLNKTYGVNIDERYRYSENIKSIAQHLVYDFISIFASSAQEDQKEVNRLRKLRHRDEMQMKRYQQNK